MSKKSYKPTKSTESLEDYAKTYCSLSSDMKDDAFSSCVVVGNSKYGKGVFTTQDVKKGDILTIYPAHWIEFFDENNRNKGISLDPRDPSIYTSTYGYLLSNKKVRIVGDPEKTDKSCMLGHLINDGCDEVDKRPNEKFGDWAIRYYLCSQKQVNCLFVEDKETKIVYVVASKDIKNGEELYLSYGYAYWAIYNNYFKKTSEDDMIKQILIDVGPKKLNFMLGLMMKDRL